MKRWTGWVAIPAGTLLLLAAQIAPAGELGGRWRLVEQRYGEGRANLADLERPLELDFAVTAAGLAGQIVSGDVSASWPAWVTDGGALPVHVLDVDRAVAGDRVRVRYRVRSAPDSEPRLEVVEEYRVDAATDALVGSMTVTFLRDGKPRGSYVLQRRFERVGP